MTDGGGKHVGAKSSQVGLTIKNLRQREDTAKYLLNLNPNSAYYDPKSRSMRANPNPGLDASDSVFVGDNVAVSGDAVKMAQAQVLHGNNLAIRLPVRLLEILRSWVGSKEIFGKGEKG